jgi:hypothetical protein
VTVLYRNQSLDEFLTVALVFKNELQSIGRNFNQAGLHLRSVSPQGEWKDAIDFLAAEEFSLRIKVDEIKGLLNKMYQLWLQK